MRADAFNFHVDPVRKEMTGMQHITIIRVCGSDDSKSIETLAEENLLQFCFTDEGESENVIVDEIST